MLNVEDYAVHRKTGWIGKVTGYGHLMLNGTYLPTLKVHLLKGSGAVQGSIIEDLSSSWMEVEAEYSHSV
ncbi:hypothetical protein H6F88_06065 [Oculatella sp. FACHB-28]|uniref:hypothetical protein n=1 Tax=Cyanophyceae TaxID=3028117 RepID=UPI001682662D|nr:MULTISPECIES: hypothetical protein [Cyanophyceae]MBD1996693.1 hypothetical protein [Leptolyngbya sp. FACHB-541]MBD2055590.1 hypothetical protein [Oculatella sp. FACHB-28]MBD2069957.1 hypothetical protein [Leptolyngbya sp. FACHB-671]